VRGRAGRDAAPLLDMPALLRAKGRARCPLRAAAEGAAGGMLDAAGGLLVPPHVPGVAHLPALGDARPVVAGLIAAGAIIVVLVAARVDTGHAAAFELSPLAGCRQPPLTRIGFARSVARRRSRRKWSAGHHDCDEPGGHPNNSHDFSLLKHTTQPASG
jgi:hypothetical protein